MSAVVRVAAAVILRPDGAVLLAQRPSGKAYAGPHEGVKLAAARLGGLSLHAYDPATRAFSSRLGCEPAGLLSRALVACSGELPRIEASTSIFKNVSRPVAAGVLAACALEEAIERAVRLARGRDGIPGLADEGDPFAGAHSR